MNEAQKERLLARLEDAIQPGEDSLRVYTLKGGRDAAVQTLGRDGYVDFADPLIV